jgi:hypothetical protein
MLPEDPEAFKLVVIADARDGSTGDEDIEDLGVIRGIHERAAELREPPNIGRWRDMLVTVLRELDTQYAARKRRSDADKVALAQADRAYLAGEIDNVEHAQAKIIYLAAKTEHDTWRASVAKFRAGMEVRLREARALAAHHAEHSRLSELIEAIEHHRVVTMADYEPTEADYELWAELS